MIEASAGAPYSPEIKNGQPTDLYKFISTYQASMKTDISVIAFGALMSGDVLLFELMLSSAKVGPSAVMNGIGPSLLVYAVAYRRPQCVKLLLNMQVEIRGEGGV